MTAVLFKFSNPDGTPVANAPFRITTRKPSFDETLHNGLQIPGDINATTDAQGEATVTLMAGAATYYLLMDNPGAVSDSDGCSAGLRYRFMVPESATVLRVEDLIVSSPTWSRPWDETALQIIIDAKLSALDSAVRAEMAAENAEAQTGIIDGIADETRAAAAEALLSKNAAAVSATDSLTSRNQAEGFKTSAETASTASSASSVLAQKWAANPENTIVAGGLYSSLHYSIKSANSATAAANSATAAAASAVTASTKAAQTTADAATVAADKATVASDKAIVAADKAIVIADMGIVAADKATVSAFGLRYAGSVSVAPTTRTNGAALQAGDEYFNTGTQLRYNWSGSAWVALNQSVTALQATLTAAGVATNSAQMTEANMNNADIPNGKYTVAVSGLGYAPTQQNGYLDISDNLSTGYQKRVYTTVVSGRTFTQLQVAGVFGAWKEETPDGLASIAALRLIAKGSIQVAHVLGYYARGDNGGGWYYYDAADTTSADNGGTVIVTTDGGRYKRSTITGLSVLHFGGKADGVFNNTPIITAMLAAGIRDIHYGAVGTFFHASSVTVPQNVNLKITGIGFRMTTLTAGVTTGYQLFYYQRTVGQPPSVVIFEDLVMTWLGTAKVVNSAAIYYYGASDAESDCWFRTERCSFYNWNAARSAKWAGQVHSTKDFFSNNTYDNLMGRGCSFWYFDSSMSFSSQFIRAVDTIADAFSNGLFINGCHNVTSTTECLYIQNWQAVFIDSCGFDLGSGGTAALRFIGCQDIYVAKCFISSNNSTTRDGVVFDNCHTGALVDSTLVNNSRAVRFLNSNSAISQKIGVKNCKFAGNAYNDILLAPDTQGCKFTSNHHQTTMDRTGTNFEIYGSVTGAGNNVCKDNTLAGATYTIVLGAGSIISDNIFGCKP